MLHTFGASSPIVALDSNPPRVQILYCAIFMAVLVYAAQVFGDSKKWQPCVDIAVNPNPNS